MIFVSRMKLLTAIVCFEDAENAARALLSSGALESVSVKDLPGEWTSRVEPYSQKTAPARFGEIRTRVEGFVRLSEGRVVLPDTEKTLSDRMASPDSGITNPDAALKTLDAIAAELDAVRNRQKGFQEEILKLDEMKRQIRMFGDLGSASTGGGYSFLSVRAGTVLSESAAQVEKGFESLPSAVIKSGEPEGGRTPLMLVSLKRDEARVSVILKKAGWEDMKYQSHTSETKEDAIREIERKTERAKDSRDTCSSEIGDILAAKADTLKSLWIDARIAELLGRVRQDFSKTAKTVLVSGWIPASKTSAVDKALRSSVKGGCFIEWSDPGKGEAVKLQPPVEMQNPKVLKPFESLVVDYAVPRYGTIDPTPFVAVAYLTMFGLMFGDAGHGLVLVIVGILGMLLARKKGKKDNLYKLITYCGGSAIVTGILFGSYFGFPVFPPVWFDYHSIVAGHGADGPIRTVYDILGITIKFGIIVLGTGLVINWINLVRTKRWLELILDKAGLLGGWIYGAGAWVAFYFVSADYKGLPPIDLLLWMLGIPTLLLALKAPLEFFLHSKKEGKKFNGFTIIGFVMEWIVEVLEIYSGYLANTLSFMRVAGLGIAHASLMIAFYSIASMVSDGGSFSVLGWVIAAIGNILVVGLEGLSAGIQSLRLNYYEFFSKYFNGNGKAYAPISFKTGM